MKPLFIPLAGVHFDRFEDGSKSHEFRLYGPRWNEKNCPIGREVLLCRGYGKKRRMPGKIVSFERIPFEEAPDVARAIFGNRPGEIAKIGIELHWHKRIHIRASIRGMLRQSDRELRGVLADKESGRPLAGPEARELLMDMLKAGNEFLPCCPADECPDFDPKEKGCPGHRYPEVICG